MAPRKEKTEKVSVNEAADTILGYLRKQNRPYSATDISANLHNKVTKAAAAKILKDLHEKKEIEGRASGKQIVYHSIQDPTETFTPTDLSNLSSRITTLQNDTTSHFSQIKTLRNSLSTLTTSIPTSTLRSNLFSLETEKASLQKRLEPLRTGTVKPVNEEEKREVEGEMGKWSGSERKRRRIEGEMWGLMRDVAKDGGLNVEELRESLGLDD